MNIQELIDELHDQANKLGSYSYEVEVNHTPISCLDTSYACVISGSNCTPKTSVQILLDLDASTTPSNPTEHSGAIIGTLNNL